MTVTSIVSFILFDFSAAEKLYMVFINWVRESPFLAFFAIVAFYTLSISFMLPIVQTHLLVGYSYAQVFNSQWIGFAVAWVVSMIGILSGALSGFLISRYLFRSSIYSFIEKNKWLNKNFKAINMLLEDNGVLIISLLRMMFTPFSILSHVLGVTNLTVTQFCLGNLAYSLILAGQIFIGASFQSMSVKDFSLSSLNSDSKAKSTIFLVEFILTIVITLGMSYYAKKLI